MNSTAATAAGLRFVQIDTAAARELTSRGVSEGAIRLFAYVSVHAQRTGECYASYQYLAAELGKSVRTICHYVRQLLTAGALERRLTGRAARLRPLPLVGEELRRRDAMDCVSHRQEDGDQEREVVVTARPPAETETAGLTTTPTMAGEEEVPDLVTVRQDLAEARDRATEWQNADPQAPETAQSRQRVAALQQQLAHVDDVRRAQEAVRQVPAMESRGGARAASERNLWRLRRAYATMAGDDWRRSVLRWCAWHRRHAHRRLGDLDGWLARERFEPITPPGEPPPLPEPPPAAASDTASNSDSVTIYQCAIALGACQFIRMVVPAGERPPERCSRCGGHVKVAGIPDIVSA